MPSGNPGITRDKNHDARFNAFVDKNGPVSEHRPDLGRCWIWLSTTNSDGYGIIFQGRKYQAHRWVYEREVEQIPDGLTLDHLCRVRICVNPLHMDPCTINENTKRSPIQVTTINANKTHCINGHLLSGKNLRLEPRGGRTCRACLIRRKREYRQRQRMKV